jgi:hypothetical protein
MFSIAFTEPSRDFVQTDKALLRCPHLTDGQKITWQLIASVCWYGESSKTINGWADVSKANGIEYKKFMDRLKSLKRAGGLIVNDDGEWELVVPTAKHEPTIQDEVEDQGKRKHNMSQKDSWELVKEGWNKNKPDSWLRLDGSMNLPVMIALETQAKRLEIQREQYGEFVGQVCRGATADSWWSSQNMKASSVFGFSKVSDKKFENVEKLYKAGGKVEKKVDYQSDAEVFARYAVYGYTRSKIERIQVKDYNEAAEIATKHNPEDTFVLYFAPNREKPVFWTGIYTDRTRYLFA